MGFSTINVELTNRCNKNCWMCGRRERENLYGDVYNKDMDFDLVKLIAKQIPFTSIVHLHNNGEGLLYPNFGDAVRTFNVQDGITSLTTNGKLIIEKADEIIDNLDTMAISIIQDDPEANEQLNLIHVFLALKKDMKPFVTLRLLGNVDDKPYKKLGCLIVKRLLHSSKGSFNYERKTTIPEIGICLDFLHHLAINVNGDVSPCVRFDPNKELILGNIKEESLADIWYGAKRMWMFELHKTGKRNKIPFCNKCDFWGIPKG